MRREMPQRWNTSAKRWARGRRFTPRARTTPAECYVNLGEYGKAIELLEGLTATDLNNAQYRIQLADARTQAARLTRRAPAR